MEIMKNQIANNVITDNITIKNSATYENSGIINGDIHVVENSRLIMQGILNGDLIVESGSNAKIFGMLNGNISSGGDVEIFGVAKTKRQIPERVIIHEGAIINDRKY